MPDEANVGARIELDISEYRRNVTQMIADAGRADAALDSIIDSAARVGRVLRDVDADIMVDVDVDDGELVSAKRKRDDLGGSETVDVQTDDSEVDQTSNKLQDLANLSIIVSVGTDLAQSILDFDPTELPVISSLIETETAVQRLRAVTGQEIPDAARIINDVYNAAWGESKDEVGEVIAAIVQLTGETTGAADIAGAAFGVAEILGEDATEVLRVAQQLVDSGVAESLQEGFDIIVEGAQSGLNRSGDLLDTLSEYAGQFESAEISAGQILSFLQEGLAAGIRNTDVLADSFKEAGIRVRDAVTGTDGFATILEGLDITALQLGIQDEINKIELSGEMPGAEFWTSFGEGVRNAVATGELTEIEAQVLFERLFGTQAEEVGYEALIDMLAAFDNPTEWQGAAESAITTLTDTFDASWTSFTRTAGQQLIDAIDERFDLQATLDRAQEAMNRFTGEIAAGESLFGALEVALEIPGLENQLQQLESTLNNFLIEMLLAFGNVLNVFDQEAAGRIFAEVERLSAGQLAFDLQVAVDEEGIQNAVGTATRRGVELSDVGEAMSTAIFESLEAGDLSSALNIRDVGADLIPTLEAAEVAGAFGIDPDLVREVTDANREATGQLETGMVPQLEAASEAIDDYTEDIAGQMTQSERWRRGIYDDDEAINEFGNSVSTVSSQAGDQVTRLADQSETAGNRINSGASKAAEGWVNFLRNVAGEPMRAFIEQLRTIQNLTPSIPTGMGGIAPTAEIPSNQFGGMFQGASLVHGGEMLVSGPSEQEIGVLNAATSRDLLSGLGMVASAIGLAGGGSGPNITNNITINSQSMAEDIGAGLQTSTLRGFT